MVEIISAVAIGLMVGEILGFISGCFVMNVYNFRQKFCPHGYINREDCADCHQE